MPYRNEAPQTVQYRGRTRHYRSSPSDGCAVAEPAGNLESGQLIQTVFFVLLVFGFFLWFASVAVTDQTIELGTKPKHLKILDLEVSYNAVVLKVTMIVAVSSGLSFVATTSSDDRHALDFLEPMVLRLRKILIIRDIYLSIFRYGRRRDTGEL